MNGNVPKQGYCAAPAVTEEGGRKQVRWIHVNVAMPTVSTPEHARNAGERRYREDTGHVVNVDGQK